MNEQEQLLFTLPVLDANLAARFFGHRNRYRLDKMRQRGQGPNYYQIGDGSKPRIKYSIRDLMLFALQQESA